MSLLGIDVGTSATKGVLIDDRGRVLAQARRGYRPATPAPGRVELDAYRVWAAARDVIGSLATVALGCGHARASRVRRRIGGRGRRRRCPDSSSGQGGDGRGPSLRSPGPGARRVRGSRRVFRQDRPVGPRHHPTRTSRVDAGARARACGTRDTAAQLARVDRHPARPASERGPHARGADPRVRRGRRPLRDPHARHAAARRPPLGRRAHGHRHRHRSRTVAPGASACARVSGS